MTSHFWSDISQKQEDLVVDRLLLAAENDDGPVHATLDSLATLRNGDAGNERLLVQLGHTVVVRPSPDRIRPRFEVVGPRAAGRNE